jgi:hypothetical protein
MADITGCSNHGCKISAPQGQGTNGRCTCPDVVALVNEIGEEIAELRDGRGRSRNRTVTLLRDVVDTFLSLGVVEAAQAGCRCGTDKCKYPLCDANRSV